MRAALALACAVVCSAESEAFCGFYVAGSNARLTNRSTMVALMRDHQRTVLSMQNSYEGPPENFALVVPVPVVLSRETVKTLPDEVFDRLDQLTAPRLVEYWEQDPCAENIGDTFDFGGLGAVGTGWGGGGAGEGTIGLGVRVEARFDVDEYEVVILSAENSSGLETWLRQERYHIPEGASAAFAPYVRAGMKFFVARVNVQRVRFVNGRAKLSPLRFHYDAETFALPVRLGLLNSPGQQDLVVVLLARGRRFVLANRPNVTIPTNLDVQDSVRDRFPEFYQSLFNATLARTPGAAVTEYAWDAGTCDPCPVPALTDTELATLGDDVLPRPPFEPLGGLSATTIGWGAGSQQPRTVFPVRALPPQVSGLLSPEAIRRVVLRNLGQVIACQDQGLTQNSQHAGRVTINFVIGSQGNVLGSSVRESNLPLPSVAQCITNAVRRWQFPSPEGGGVVTVNYPFMLYAPPTRTAEPRAPDGGVQGWPGSFVATRIHLRYGQELTEDLVFSEAPPIAGGREEPPLSTQAAPSAYNNFQARYAIRHRWTGPVRCDAPRFQNWGGPPNGEASTTRSARDLAFVQGGFSLPQALNGVDPFTGTQSPVPPTPTPPTPTPDAGRTPTSHPTPATTHTTQRSSRCDARTPGSTENTRLPLLALALLLFQKRARRSRVYQQENVTPSSLRPSSHAS